MGKKRLRSKKASKGQRRSVAKMTSHWSLAEKLIFKAEAKKQGKRVCETVPNPNKEDKSRLFIRVCTSGKTNKNG